MCRHTDLPVHLAMVQSVGRHLAGIFLVMEVIIPKGSSPVHGKHTFDPVNWWCVKAMHRHIVLPVHLATVQLFGRHQQGAAMLQMRTLCSHAKTNLELYSHASMSFHVLLPLY